MSKRRKTQAAFGLLPNHSDAIAKMSTKSAMSPLLWGAGVLVSLLLAGAYWIEGSSRVILVGLVGIIVVFVLAAYSYFAIRDPDRLQSEEYMVARQHLDVLRESGKSPTTIDLSAEQTPNDAVENRTRGQIDG